MRGKRCLHWLVFCGIRITPAGAGKTLRVAGKSVAYKHHPRRCGENKKLVRTLLCSSASPPQVRGKHGGSIKGISLQGITPAGAGKTNHQPRQPEQLRHHPRRCGENRAVGTFYLYDPGITPAGAGKTFIGAFCPNVPRHHPRRCGENVLRWLREMRSRASPPQVRGKPLSHLKTSNFVSITPAGAGKTSAA